jgi:hypothetical protein
MQQPKNESRVIDLLKSKQNNSMSDTKKLLGTEFSENSHFLAARA